MTQTTTLERTCRPRTRLVLPDFGGLRDNNLVLCYLLTIELPETGGTATALRRLTDRLGAEINRRRRRGVRLPNSDAIRGLAQAEVARLRAGEEPQTEAGRIVAAFLRRPL